MQRSMCPVCGEVIGGSDHALDVGNSVAVSLLELANMALGEGRSLVPHVAEAISCSRNCWLSVQQHPAQCWYMCVWYMYHNTTPA